MKKIITCLAVALFSTGAFAQYYFNSYPAAGINPGSLNADLEYPLGGGLTTGWSPIVGPSVSIPAWSANQTIPFPFSFNGVSETSYKVSSTGVLTFSTAATSVPSATKAALPSASIPDKSVCIWGVQAIGTNDYVLTKTFGTAPNRQHWVFFSSNALGGTGWSYWSIVLEETSNNIYIVDQRHSGTTGGVSMGIQINSTTAASVGSNVMPIAGADPSAADNAYYEFIQGIAPPDDIEMISINTNASPGVATSIQGSLKNKGSDTLQSYTMSWTVDGGTTLNTSIITQQVLPGAITMFTHPTQWTPNAGGYILEVSASLPNGNVDADLANNSVQTPVLVGSSGNSVSKNPLLEEYTTAPCQFCPDGAVEVEAALAQTPSAIGVGLHACFGTDAMTIPEASTYCAAFGTGAPTATIDRILFPGQANVAISRGGGAWRSRTAFQATVGSPVDVTLTGSYNPSTRLVNVDLSSNFVNYAAGDIRVTLFVVEDHVRGIGAGYNQVNAYNGVAGHPYFGAGNPIVNYDHRHVLRDVYPTNDAWGDNTVIPQAPRINTPYTKNHSFTLNNSWNADSVSLVGFVSYYNSDVGQREVLNAVEVKLGNIPTTVDEIKKDANSLNIYPNPTADLTNIAFNLSKPNAVTLTVRDITGKEVMSQNFGMLANGQQKIAVNVANLSNGIYFTSLQIGDEIITKKITVNK